MKKMVLVFALVGLVAVLWAPALFAQWEPDQRLSLLESMDSATEIAWNITAIGNTVWVVWHDFRDGQEEIYYKTSTDGGTQWSGPTRLTDDDDASSYHASVALSGSTVHVVWLDKRIDGYEEVYYNRSLDGGASWMGDTRLTFVGGC
jgi:hypothetical protein